LESLIIKDNVDFVMSSRSKVNTGLVDLGTIAV